MVAGRGLTKFVHTILSWEQTVLLAYFAVASIALLKELQPCAARPRHLAELAPGCLPCVGRMIRVSCRPCRSALGAILAAGGLKRGGQLSRVIVERYPLYSSAEYVRNYFYSTTPRLAASSDLVEQRYQNDDAKQDNSNNEYLKRDTSSVNATSSDRNESNTSRKNRLKALEAELPGIVDEILAFHDEMGTTRKRSLREEWKRAFRYEQQRAQNLALSHSWNSRSAANSRSSNPWGTFGKRTEVNSSVVSTNNLASWDDRSSSASASASDSRGDIDGLKSQGWCDRFDRSAEPQIWNDIGEKVAANVWDKEGLSLVADSWDDGDPSTAAAPSLGPNLFEDLGAEVRYSSLECRDETKSFITSSVDCSADFGKSIENETSRTGSKPFDDHGFAADNVSKSDSLPRNSAASPGLPGNESSVAVVTSEKDALDDLLSATVSRTEKPRVELGSGAMDSSLNVKVEGEQKVQSVDTETCKGLSQHGFGKDGERQVEFAAKRLRDYSLRSGLVKSCETTPSLTDAVASGGKSASAHPTELFSLTKCAPKSDSNQDKNRSMLDTVSENLSTSSDAVKRAIVLLRILGTKEWRTFDRLLDEKKDDEQVERFNKFFTGEERRNEIESEASSPSVDTNGFDAVEIDGDSSMQFMDGEDNALSGSLKLISDLFKDSRIATSEHLSTSEYNSVLARVALSPELFPEEMLNILMQLHFQMEGLAEIGFNECRPDATTYEILLLALNHRLPASGNAIGIVKGFMISNPNCWTVETVEAALLLFEKQNATKLALQLFDNLHEKQLNNVDLSNRAYRSMIYLTQFDNNKEKAFEVLRLALQKNSKNRDHDLDAVFIDAIKWPRRNRFGKAIDNKSVLSEIIDLFINERTYNPSFSVWRELIVAAAKRAHEDESRWRLIARAFQCLSWSAPGYHPDHILLKHGLHASRILEDSVLASDVLWRSVENSRIKIGPNRPDVPFKDFLKAMEVCMNAGDMISCRKILTCAKRAEMTDHSLRALYLLNLKGFANRGDVQPAEMLILDMHEKSLQPDEDSFAALLHAYAIAKDFKNAHLLLLSIESGEMGIQPGSSTYDAYTLACIRCGAWSDVLAAYRKMKERGIEPSPPTCHGILFAAFKNGGRSTAKDLLEDFLAAGIQLTEASALLAIRIMVSSKIVERSDSLASARENLRKNSNDDAGMQQATLDLMRSLRRCELAKDRKPSGGLTEHSLQEERRQAWRNALKHLLAYANQTERTAPSTKKDEINEM